MSFGTNFPHNRKKTLYVGGISHEIDEKILTMAFIPFGEIVGVSIPLDYETGKNRGFGLVSLRRFSSNLF
jgi:peptidyl-prolyl isomerase E (cyclophilin E)